MRVRAAMSPEEIDRAVKQVLLKDLRIQCRARGISPAGGKEQLAERVREHMLETGDFSMKNETGEDLVINTVAGTNSADVAQGFAKNNYSRPSGQNVGNFMTDRNSSRVLAPPGGATSIVFGDASSAAAENAPSPRSKQAAPLSPAAIAGLPAGRPGPPPGALSVGSESRANNNYARPSGQNVGNFLTDKNSSRVVAPPGGTSQIIFG
ncbi:hypothetical protein MNEG_7059 [Monoraphidium neglectum]|uniref:SAP domain-containing protein n=1 Tax=Monoraphidium neglectum TaxID=145388 RepID=A0A0D2L0E9_9CHLO|nr:hypothetical protein MNEG_7059 [Monoraphidium neglectum]KIZ00904.1 hypothetical protein MNEG_7059 [Monoraphidium neglectum]|eukprot:XP_013899923.1 hypothetical protein MNEG_7059 [Monoraphidium neglectum]